jgi:hypothetical protein
VEEVAGAGVEKEELGRSLL